MSYRDTVRPCHAAAGQRRPAVVIEDVDWADASTVELLNYLLAPGHAVEVPVALTARSSNSHHAWR
jgi:predicted ATPase